MYRSLLHICVRPLKVARSTNRAMREPHTVGRVTSTDSHAFLFLIIPLDCESSNTTLTVTVHQ